jgi:hypothetical protein
MYCIELAVDLFFPLFVADLRSTGSLLPQFLFAPDLILLPSPDDDLVALHFPFATAPIAPFLPSTLLSSLIPVSVANLLLSAACPRQQKLSLYHASLSEQLTFFALAFFADLITLSTVRIFLGIFSTS